MLWFIRRMLSLLLIFLAFLYVVVFLFAFFYGDKIIFQPQRATYRDSGQIIKLRSGKEALISAVHLENPEARYTILYHHGNAEDIGLLLPILKEIRDYGFAVLAYDYRGYGTSSGSPSEASAYQDADAAYQYLTQQLRIPPAQIIALGRSLGGAVAVDLASRQPLGGLIIESSFLSAYRVMTQLPLFPLDKFRSAAKLKKINCPVLVIHGTADEVIPFRHGQTLFRLAPEPKQHYWVVGAGHNNLFEVANIQYAITLRKFAALLEVAQSQ
jgi:abhydrolase domain-containing protein 17